MTDAAPTIVVLVPGTFARNATWTKPCGELHRALTAAQCRCVPFDWTCDNSHIARIRAADELATVLAELRKSNSTAPLVVIGHSHGGNVALHAVHGPGRADVGATLVTLATPFVLATPRRTGVLVPAAALVAGLSCAVVALTPVASALRWVAAAVAATTLVLVALVAAGMPAHGNPLRRAHRERFVARVDAPAVGPGALLAVRASGDEASGLLVGAQFTAWVGMRIVWLTRPDRWGRAAQVATLAFAAALLVGIEALSGTALTVLGGFALAAGLLSVVAVAVLLVGALTFGLDGPAGSLHASITAEATPPGRASVLQMRPAADGRPRQLAHSSPYLDDDVVHSVVEHVTHAAGQWAASSQLRP